MQDGADAVEGPKTGNNITKRVNNHGYEGRHLGGTDAESWVNDRYHAPRLVRRCHRRHRHRRQYGVLAWLCGKLLPVSKKQCDIG